MNLTLALPGDDAPAVAFDGARLTLTYADLAAYGRRCSADDAAVRALASHVVTDASVAQRPIYHGGPLATGPMVASYALSASAKPSPNEQPKTRR
jgi:hypothetical protein